MSTHPKYKNLSIMLLINEPCTSAVASPIETRWARDICWSVGSSFLSSNRVL